MISIGSMGTGEIKSPFENTDMNDVYWAVEFFITVRGTSVDFFSLPADYQKHILNCIVNNEETEGFFYKA